ncbi:binding protein [[Candida] boidinii]|nr:binding protein [[Candida] boidinii]OWB78978.1 binding protein [[Candida] boidinii]
MSGINTNLSNSPNSNSSPNSNPSPNSTTSSSNNTSVSRNNSSISSTNDSLNRIDSSNSIKNIDTNTANKNSSSSSSSSADSKIKKTRRRIPISCLSCRKRKMKCDRQKPCANCVKSKSNCSYTPQLWEVADQKLQLSSEILKLKMQVNRLEKLLLKHNIDPHDAYGDLVTSSSQIHDISTNNNLSSDPLVSLTHKFDKLVIKENRILRSGPTSYAAFIIADKYLAQMFNKYFIKHKAQYEVYLQSQQIKPSSENIINNPSHLVALKSAYDDFDFCFERHDDSYALLPNNTARNPRFNNFMDHSHAALLKATKEKQQQPPPSDVTNRSATTSDTSSSSASAIRMKSQTVPPGLPTQGVAPGTAEAECGQGGPITVNQFAPDSNYSPSVSETASSFALIDQVNQLLPPTFAINGLVDYFFQKTYYILPYIDETLFREDLSYILIEDKPSGRSRIEISHPAHLTTVSLLLIVLRLAYLTINVQDYYVDPNLIDNANLAAILRSGISIDKKFVELSKFIIMSTPGEHNILRKITLQNIQVLLCLRLYRVLSPEDGDESYDSAILFAMIVQMLRMQGMFRDPDNYNEVITDERVKVLWRRIYYKVLYLDVMQSLNFGCPLTIPDNEWDIRLPELNNTDKKILQSFKTGNAINISSDKLKNIIREDAINKEIFLEYDLTILLRKSVKLSHSLNDPCKRSDFNRLFQEIRDFLSLRINNFNDLVNNKVKVDAMYTIFNIPRFKEFMIRHDLMVVYLNLNYLLYLVFENEDEEEDSPINPFLKRNSSSTAKTPSTVDSEDQERQLKFSESYLKNAFEAALIILKSGFDFLEYISSDSLTNSDNPKFNNLKSFFNGFEDLVSSQILTNLQNSLFFSLSLLVRGQFENVPYGEFLLNLNNSTDSIDVLNWFNVSITKPDGKSNNNSNNNSMFDNEGDNSDNNDRISMTSDKEFCITLFHYVKQVYLKTFQLKDRFFACWRISMLTRIFINYFKNDLPDFFKELTSSYELFKIKNSSFTSNIPFLKNQESERQLKLQEQLRQQRQHHQQQQQQAMSDQEQIRTHIQLQSESLLSNPVYQSVGSTTSSFGYSPVNVTTNTGTVSSTSNDMQNDNTEDQPATPFTAFLNELNKTTNDFLNTDNNNNKPINVNFDPNSMINDGNNNNVDVTDAYSREIIDFSTSDVDQLMYLGDEDKFLDEIFNESEKYNQGALNFTFNNLGPETDGYKSDFYKKHSIDLDSLTKRNEIIKQLNQNNRNDNL